MKLRICLMLILLLTVMPISAQDDTPLLYRVAFVSGYDPLDIHASAGMQKPVIGSLPLDSADITITGKSKIADQVEWVPIQQDDQAGWVNRAALTEQIA